MSMTSSRNRIEAALELVREATSEGSLQGLVDLIASIEVEAYNPGWVLDLVYADFCRRRESGYTVSPSEYILRFPDLAVELEQLFEVDLILFPGETARHAPKLRGFVVERELGRGSTSVVYLARQKSIGNRLVALKLGPSITREPQMLGKLEHPHIVPIHSYHVDLDSGMSVICMPHYPSISLSHFMKECRQRGRMPLDSDEMLDLISTWVPEERDLVRRDGVPTGSYEIACCWIMCKLAGALEHAHSKRVLHLDIKPSNILLTESGKPLVVDFNLALDADSPEGRHCPGGTLPYMSPEQLRSFSDGSYPVDRRSDIYSLAITICELICGEHPFGIPVFDLSTHGLKLERQKRGDAPDLLTRVAISSDARRILMKCLKSDPAERYQSMQEIEEDLVELLAGRPLRHAYQPSGWDRVEKYAKRNSKRLVLFLVTSAVFFLFGSLLVGRFLDGKHSASDFYVKGRQAYASRHYQDAEANFSEAINRGLRAPNAFYYRGRCRLLRGVLSEAKRDFDRAIELDSGFAHAYLKRAGIATDYDAKATIEDVTTALTHARTDPNLHQQMPRFLREAASHLAKVGQHRHASQLLHEALGRGLDRSLIDGREEFTQAKTLPPLSDWLRTHE